MNERREIRGTMNAAYTALLRARCAVLEGLQEEDCMLSPKDMSEMNKTRKDMKIVLSDIEKGMSKFNEVSIKRLEITV
jgi:hypothetical protein